MSTGEVLLTQKEAAAEMGVTTRTIRNWMDRGILVPTLIGYCRRVSRENLRAIIKEETMGNSGKEEETTIYKENYTSIVSSDAEKASASVPRPDLPEAHL